MGSMSGREYWCMVVVVVVIFFLFFLATRVLSERIDEVVEPLPGRVICVCGCGCFFFLVLIHGCCTFSCVLVYLRLGLVYPWAYFPRSDTFLLQSVKCICRSFFTPSSIVHASVIDSCISFTVLIGHHSLLHHSICQSACVPHSLLTASQAWLSHCLSVPIISALPADCQNIPMHRSVSRQLPCLYFVKRKLFVRGRGEHNECSGLFSLGVS